MKDFLKDVWTETNKKQKGLIVLFSPIMLMGIIWGFFRTVFTSACDGGEALFEQVVEWGER